MGWQDAPLVNAAPASAQPAWASAPLVNAGPPSMARQLAMSPVGGAELLGKLTTGAVASIPAALAYGGAAVGKAFGANVDPAQVQRDVQNYFTYQPHTDSGKAGEQTMASAIAPATNFVSQKYGQATQAVAKQSPFAGELMKAAPGAFQAASSLVPTAAGFMRSGASTAPVVVSDAADVGAAMSKPLYQPPPRTPITPPVQQPDMTAEDILARQAAASPQSMGAAAASPNLTGVSPELKEAVVKTAQKTGGAINPDVFARHAEANTLPVPISLTEGMATQSPQLISMEQNMRARYPQLIERYNTINQQLGQNVQAIRDAVGPDVFTTNHVEHGDALIGAYREKAAAADAVIGDLYGKLRDAAGQNFPVDAKALLENASKELHKKLLFDHAPPEVMRTLDRLAQNGMTFENFESLRTNLARTMRSPSADGNVKAAAGVIREEMEKLPLDAAAAQLKPYADAARSAARAQFQALEADPAYKAAVEGTVAPDRFVSRFVINAPRDDVLRMRDNLSFNPTAIQTIGVSALDHLRDAARLNPHYEGNFAAASYNKALQGLSPKMQALLPPAAAENLEKLGNVARYTTAQPKGSFVNNSNTFVSSVADYGAGALEGAANVAAHGVPVGTWGRKAINKIREGKTVQNSLQVGAGLGNLNPQGPP